MIRTLLATTAIAALMSSGAIAQEAAPATTEAAPAAAAPAAPAPATTEAVPAAGAAVESGAVEETDVDEPWNLEQGYVAVDSDNLGSELIDQPVYSSAGDDAEEIGNITDIIFAEDGRISGVVIGVGGFLGIGEKTVAVPFSMLEFALAADNTERWVVQTTAEALTAAPEFVWEEDEPADGDDVAPAADAEVTAPATDAMAPAADAMAPAADAAADTTAATAGAAAAATGAAVAPMAMPREGFNTIETEALTADNLTGATVIGPDGNDIAEVEDLLLTADGQVDALLVDFGGFLGLGQKTVAVALENLEFAANEGGDLVIYSDFTREQLEAQPDYDEATYATTPAQRVTDQ